MPTSNCWQSNLIWDGSNGTFTPRENLTIYTWTFRGNQVIKRALLNFDLSLLDSSVSILNAKLSLYYNPTESTETFDFHTGQNEFYIERITTDWSYKQVNWLNQPMTTIQNRLSVPASTSGTQNYTNLDVTALISDMIHNPDSGFGMMLKMQTETLPHRGLLFASERHPDISLRPTLEIVYMGQLVSPKYLPNDTIICSNDSILITLHDHKDHIKWYDGDTSQIKYLRAGLHWVDILQCNGQETRDSILIESFANSMFNLGADTTLCSGQSISLDATSPNSTYLWQDGSTNAIFTVKNEGTYFVLVQNACEVKSDTLTITAKDCDCNIIIPNIYTPNNDGINDVFFPKLDCDFSEYELIIFNRWGEEVFRSNTPNETWDGRLNGKKVSDGSYVYLLKYKLLNELDKTLVGNITLIR